MVLVKLESGKKYIENLKTRLKNAEISYTEVADEIGVELSQFSRWMRQRVSPRIDAVIAIENAILSIQRRRRKK